jgi:hypothetical protein
MIRKFSYWVKSKFIKNNINPTYISNVINSEINYTKIKDNDIVYYATLKGIE